MSVLPAPQPLSGRVIALAETRELDLFADMLEKRGARVLRCPLVSIKDAPDPAPIEHWLRRCIDGEFDDLILLTGEGLRRLLGFAERAGLRADFVAALEKIRKVTRGPKPVRALREIGLRTDLPASAPTTEGIITTLATEPLGGRRVAVQLYGAEPNPPLAEFLTGAGATVTTVAPYIYADAAETERVLALIRALIAGEVDALAFTSTPQVKRLLEVAANHGMQTRLHDALLKTPVAAVGPLIVQVLETAGLHAHISAPEPFSLKPLVNAICETLGPKL